MSTVLVVRKKGIACIGADTLTTFGSMRQPGYYKSAAEKLFQLGDSYVAMTGSPAHRLVLESAWSGRGEAPSLSSPQAIFECFRALHPRLKGEYFVNPKEGEKDPYESSQMDFLIANRHGVFGLMSFRECYEYTRFWSIGSGSEIALGAMHVAYDLDLSAQEIAELGLKAAVEFDNSTAAPLTLYTVKLDKPGTT